MLGILDHVLERIGWWLLLLSGALVFGIFASILFGTFARIAMTPPPAWPDPATEYALLLATVLAAPRLVREGGHVVVDALLRSVSKRIGRMMMITAYLLAALASGAMAMAAGAVTIEAVIHGYTDVRAISVPFSVLSAPIFVSFLLVAAECLRVVAKKYHCWDN